MAHISRYARVVSAVCLIGLCCGQVMAGGNTRLFEPGSYAQILTAHHGRAFVMVFWSTDCSPCREELVMLGRYRRTHPGIELVLVSVDGPGAREEVTRVLGEDALTAVQSWIFSGVNADRLRFQIDPSWYGTVPRTYLFDAGGHRETVSGKLERAVLKAWYGSNSIAR